MSTLSKIDEGATHRSSLARLKPEGQPLDICSESVGTKRTTGGISASVTTTTYINPYDQYRIRLYSQCGDTGNPYLRVHNSPDATRLTGVFPAQYANHHQR
jgi:hypothetical protein